MRQVELALVLISVFLFFPLHAQELKLATPSTGVPVLSEIVMKTPASWQFCRTSPPNFLASKTCYMSRENAMKFCAEQGWHLPTARELAEVAVTRGAKIKESSECSTAECIFYSGYQHIWSLQEASFFYSWGDFQMNEKDELEMGLMASSRIPFAGSNDETVFKGYFAYAIHKVGAVRCVVGKQ